MLVPRRAFPVPFAIVAAAVTTLLVLFAIVRTQFWTYGADSGTFAQAILNTPDAMSDDFEGGSHFAVHFSPILALLYPLLALTHSLLALQLVQIALVIAAVCGFYVLIEPHVGRRLAIGLGILALLYPPVPALAFSEFHELSFAPVLLVAMLIALDRRSWTWYAVATAAALCVREDVAVVILCLGIGASIVGAVTRKRETILVGAGTAFAAAAVLAAYFGAIVPHFGSWGPSHFYAYGSVVGAAFATGLWQRTTYVLEILVPLALLPLLTRWWGLAIPGLAIVLLANSAEVWRMGMHYEALWLPWILVASAIAVAELRRSRGERFAFRWICVAIGTSLAALFVADPMHLGHYLRPSYRDLASARRALDCVPSDATLATHDEWFAATALERRHVRGARLDGSEYYVFADDYPNVEFQNRTLPALREAARSRYHVVCRYGSVVVYRRVPT